MAAKKKKLSDKQIAAKMKKMADILSKEMKGTVPAATKRGRGRPKGSKNRKQYGPVYDKELAGKPGKRGRGRPKGSKNAVQYGPVYDSAKAGKRGRGRPKGSKNKTTLTLTPLKGNKHHIRLDGEVVIN